MKAKIRNKYDDKYSVTVQLPQTPLELYDILDRDLALTINTATYTSILMMSVSPMKCARAAFMMTCSS